MKWERGWNKRTTPQEACRTTWTSWSSRTAVYSETRPWNRAPLTPADSHQPLNVPHLPLNQPALIWITSDVIKWRHQITSSSKWPHQTQFYTWLNSRKLFGGRSLNTLIVLSEAEGAVITICISDWFGEHYWDQIRVGWQRLYIIIITECCIFLFNLNCFCIWHFENASYCNGIKLIAWFSVAFRFHLLQ